VSVRVPDADFKSANPPVQGAGSEIVTVRRSGSTRPTRRPATSDYRRPRYAAR
jgi:hypothetical protein